MCDFGDLGPVRTSIVQQKATEIYLKTKLQLRNIQKKGEKKRLFCANMDGMGGLETKFTIYLFLPVCVLSLFLNNYVPFQIFSLSSDFRF